MINEYNRNKIQRSIKNCYTYEDCPKAYTSINPPINKESIKFIFMGCWGVYCSNETIKGSRYGGLSVSELLTEITNKVKTQGVILGGDNIYPWYKEKDKGGDYTNVMKRQLDVGFKQCFKNVNVEEYLVAVGNHDIEKCEFIQTQINYKKWKFPALYYNIVYRLKKGNIVNLIFIDTNIYTQSTYCDGKKYAYNQGLSKGENERINMEKLMEYTSRQFQWLKHVLEQNRNSFNIVIGHVPPIYNPHKIEDGSHVHLALDILKLSHMIDLYMCADEHNQQFLNSPFFPPCVVAGSGGNKLDNLILPERNSIFNRTNHETLFAKSRHGCVLLNVQKNKIGITFYGIEDIGYVTSNPTIYGTDDVKMVEFSTSTKPPVKRMMYFEIDKTLKHSRHGRVNHGYEHIETLLKSRLKESERIFYNLYYDRIV